MFVEDDFCECCSSWSFDEGGGGGGFGGGVFNMVCLGSVLLCRSLPGVNAGDEVLVNLWKDCDADCVSLMPEMDGDSVHNDGLRRGVSSKVGIIMVNNEIVWTSDCRL